MEQNDGDGVGLEIKGGRIHFRIGGMTAPRTMPYSDCTGVSLRMAPIVTGLGMSLRYRVDLLGREGEPAILIGDTANFLEARKLWRRAAGELEKPAVTGTPDNGEADSAPAGAPPAGISRSDEGGRIRVTVRRGRMEYVFVSALALGLAAILVFGEQSDDSAFFMLLAAGLLGYAVIAGLSSRFIEIADSNLTAGLRTPLGEFAKVEMPLREIETALWGRTEKGWGNIRSAFAMATEQQSKSFDRLTEDQARWLTRFVREAVRN